MWKTQSGGNRHLMWTERRRRACLILHFTVRIQTVKSMAYRFLSSEKSSAGGVRKVTTGITGLWQPSVHSDVAF